MAHAPHRSRPRLRVVDGGRSGTEVVEVVGPNFAFGQNVDSPHDIVSGPAKSRRADRQQVSVSGAGGNTNLDGELGGTQFLSCSPGLENTRLDHLGHSRPHISWLDEYDRDGHVLSMRNVLHQTKYLTGRAIPAPPPVWLCASMKTKTDATRLKASAAVRAWRRQYGWSQDELAARMGLNGYATVSRLERGDRWNDDNRQRLADAFGLSVDHFTGAGIMPPNGPEEEGSDGEESSYTDADFMVDAKNALRAFCRNERVEMDDDQITRTAFNVVMSIALKSSDREARLMLLQAHIDGRRQLLRETRLAEQVGARPPAEKTA